MARTTIGIAVIAGTLAASGAAQAQDHPVFLPTRDVAVTYQLSGGPGGPAQTTHMYYSAAANKLRIDTPGDAGFTILDRNAGQRIMVMNTERSYAAIPLDPGTESGFILNSTMTYRRQGPGSVAGIPCTNWSVSSPHATGQACVTNDGVLLSGSGHQADGGGDTSLVASNVDYAPQPTTLFEPPAGFRKLDPSQMQGPPGQGGPGGPGGGPPPGQGAPGGPPPGSGGQ
jgi:hypothetical protein